MRNSGLGECEVCGTPLVDNGGWEDYGDTRAWHPCVECPNEENHTEPWDPPIVYVAGPYTSDPEGNTRKAIEVGETLANLGFVPFIPHLTHYYDAEVERLNGAKKPSSWWYEYDNVFLKQCDCLFRIAGQSTGADNEEKLARKLGIPVFYSISDIVMVKNRGELC